VLFGEAAGMIEGELRRAQETPMAATHASTESAAGARRPYSIAREQGLQQAVTRASRLAEPGDVVLLAPGGTSFDEFKDFEERGDKFQSWVQAL
jgi:UDP-N-acetylmuramoylalanine--D-glutamate ligase